jgi:hypothetical protein
VRHQHVHDVAVGELDLDQHLAAADIVVDEEGPLEIGFERALDLAGDDVEILRLLERPNDALAEADEQQQVLGRAAQDPGAVRSRRGTRCAARSACAGRAPAGWPAGW